MGSERNRRTVLAPECAFDVMVPDDWACPECGENETDDLAVDPDGERVVCESCGCQYALI